MQNFDIWTHLATGRWIAEHKSIPHIDIFSATSKGRSWITHEWAAQLIFYLIFNIFSVKELVFLKAILYAVVGILICLKGIRTGESAWLISLTGIPAAYLVAMHATVRPHVFTVLLFTITLITVYLPKKISGKSLFYLPPMFIIWSNLHSGVVFGLVLLFYRTSISLLQYLIAKEKTFDQLKQMALLSMLCLAGSLINPNTYHTLLYPFLFFRNAYLFSLISELRPIYDPRFSGADFQYAYITLAILSLVVFFKTLSAQKTFRISADLLLWIVFFYLSIKSIRNIPLWAVFSALSVIHYFSPSAGKEIPDRRRFHQILSVFLIILTIALFVRTVIYGTSYGSVDERREIPSTDYILSRNYPISAGQFIKTVKPAGRMFNAFPFGSYLIWHLYPEPNVFIDGRLFLYTRDEIKDYSNLITGRNFDLLIKKYNISYCVLPFPTTSAWRKSGIHRELEKSNQWMLVFWSDNALIYIRHTPANESIIKKYQVSGATPIFRTLADIKRQCQEKPNLILKEVERLYPFDPNGSSYNVYGGFAAFEAGKWQMVISYFSKIPPDLQSETDIRYRMGYAYRAMKEYDPAERMFLEILKKHPSHYQALFQMAMLYHERHRFHEAEEYYQRAFRINDHDPVLLQNMGILYAEQKQYDRAESLWRKALSLDPGSNGIRHNLDRLNLLRNNSNDRSPSPAKKD